MSPEELTRQPRATSPLKMTERRLSLFINVSILVILTIFGALLSLPLQLLLDTNYYTRNQSVDAAAPVNVTSEKLPRPIDLRKLRRCPNMKYEDRMRSVYQSDYDGNCTYVRLLPKRPIEEIDVTCVASNEKAADENWQESKEIIGENGTEDAEDAPKARRMKSIPVAGHILVTMLLVSAIAALVEVLRVRFSRNKDSTKGDANTPRRISSVDFSAPKRFVPRQPMRSQRSFEVQGMHRLLGARPPLIRRSSFPTQPAKQSASSIAGTPNRMSRRQSAESDEEIGGTINALHHRTRLIRRH